MNDPRLKYVSPWLQMMMHPKNDPRYKNWTALEFDGAKQIYQLDSALLRRMKDAGGGVSGGNGFDSRFLLSGIQLEALQAATISSARFLNLADSLGTVEKGKIADLVLLEANPLDDIHNTTKIAAVVRDGRLLRQTELQKLLAEVETAAG